jgi:hypothetical protein
LVQILKFIKILKIILNRKIKRENGKRNTKKETEKERKRKGKGERTRKKRLTGLAHTARGCVRAGVGANLVIIWG